MASHPKVASRVGLEGAVMGADVRWSQQQAPGNAPHNRYTQQAGPQHRRATTLGGPHPRLTAPRMSHVIASQQAQQPQQQPQGAGGVHRPGVRGRQVVPEPETKRRHSLGAHVAPHHAPAYASAAPVPVAPQAGAVRDAGPGFGQPGVEGRRVRERPLVKLTVGLLATYKQINQVYYEKYPNRRKRTASKAQVPSAQAHGGSSNNNGSRRGEPSVGGAPVNANPNPNPNPNPVAGPSLESATDKNGDLVVKKGDLLGNRYLLQSLLGKGSFGQVIKAVDRMTNELVAVKVIKGRKAFFQQAQREIEILVHLNNMDREGSGKFIRMRDHFVHASHHQCIVFELLAHNLYDVIRQTKYKGIKLSHVRHIGAQVLSCQQFLAQDGVGVIHCDIKPENILLCSNQGKKIKVIDFGSSCFKHKKVFSYIQSRFYRSPEVILGMSYSLPIDCWSIACVLVELLTGKPLFGGVNAHDQVERIVRVLGFPPSDLLVRAPRTSTYFHLDSSGVYSLKPAPPSPQQQQQQAPLENRSLAQIIGLDGPATWYRDKACTREELVQFHDLIAKLLDFDPDRRLTAEAALRHEFFVSPPVVAVPVAQPGSVYSARGRPGRSGVADPYMSKQSATMQALMKYPSTNGVPSKSAKQMTWPAGLDQVGGQMPGFQKSSRRAHVPLVDPAKASFLESEHTAKRKKNEQ